MPPFRDQVSALIISVTLSLTTYAKRVVVFFLYQQRQIVQKRDKLG